MGVPFVSAEGEKFDLNITSASYNSYSGVLTIYDNNFFNNQNGIYYSAYLSKIKIGGLTLSGRASFVGVGKLVIALNSTSKELLNKVEGFDKNGVVNDGVQFQNSSILKNKSEGINTSITIASNNSSFTNIKVEGYYPPPTINSMKANRTTFDYKGGTVTIIVSGTYLYTNSTNIMLSDGKNIYQELASPTSVSYTINIPPNKSNEDQIINYIAYLNMKPTNHMISIKVTAEKIINKEIDNFKENENNNGKQNINDKSNKNNKSNSKQDIINIDNRDDDNTDIKDSVNKNNKGKPSVMQEDKKDTNNKTFKVQIVVFITIIILFIVSVIYLKRKRKI